MTRRPHPSALVVSVVVAVSSLVSAGCAPTVPEPARATSPAPAPSTPPAAPTAAADLRAVAEDAVEGLGVVAGTNLTRTGDDTDADGARTLTWTAQGGSWADDPQVVVHLVAAEGWTVTAAGDGSVVVHDEAGVARVGVAPPVVTTPEGASRPVVVPEATADGVLTLTLEAGPTAEDGAPGDVDLTLHASTTAVASLTWGDREGGRSLAVVPTAWARGGHEAALKLLRAELNAAEPESATAVMDDQLVCHTVGAPDKESWNLEPWRPDIGLLGVLAAACNPT